MSKMFNRIIRVFSILCLLYTSIYTGRVPIMHHGRCSVDGEIGYCKPRTLCWESDSELNSSNRSVCLCAKRTDLICCRRRTPIQITSTQSPVAKPNNSDLLPPPGVCGVDPLMNRIFHGERADIKEFGWAALLLCSNDDLNYWPMCGGSLINNRWILTAAHCVVRQYNIRVRLGEWNTTSTLDCQQYKNGDKVCAPPHIDINVDLIKPHEQYGSSSNHVNDIALLRLSHPVNYTDFVIPICLPPAKEKYEDSYSGMAMDIVGWGKTNKANFEGSSIKMKAILEVISISECQRVHHPIYPGQMCTGGQTPQGSCRGDSGGALMLRNTSFTTPTYYAIGIISLGQKYCSPRRLPQIFTRVEFYVPWIIDTMLANS